MSGFDPTEYKGNAIFRNQPNHSYFDKPFEDEEDCLFLCLNEIDPHFLHPQQKTENINISNAAITDPRTKQPIINLCYDHTTGRKTKIFNCYKKSMMTETEHVLGVRVLNLLQQSLEVEEEDMYNWYRIQKTRLKENQSFQKFVLEFSQNNSQIYAPCKKLIELYQNWYNSKVSRLLKRYPEETYNTHLGLPSVLQCKNNLKYQLVKITNQEIVYTLGDPYCLEEDELKTELQKFHYTISSFAEVYNNSEDLKDCMEDNMQNHFEQLVEQEAVESPSIYIPLDSLIFLLTAGDYIDMPTEMLLNIKETEETSKKFIIMDLPLPSGRCGLHSYTQIVEQATLALGCVKLSNTLEQENLMSNSCPNNPSVFKAWTLQEFMSKYKSGPDKICKFSKTLTKWQLTDLEGELFQLFTTLDSFVENKAVFLKLEHKPSLGCEVFTKCEVLRELFKMKLVGASQSSCLRIDTTNYQIMLEEPINQLKLEECLSLMYRLSFNQLLNNLFEFLKILYNMPVGDYMLRHNPKFKNKLMLCKPSTEITQNTIYLHKLLNTNVTDVEFMSQQIGLPIDENLCSLMHIQHKILPASFSPYVKGGQKFSNNRALPSKVTKTTQPKKELKKPALNKSKRKRIGRKRREFIAIKAKNDQMELENEMEFDRKMMHCF